MKKLHFIWSAGKEPNESFAKTLIAHFGQHSADDADMDVVADGDGKLLHTMLLSGGKPVFGVLVPGSNSRGFWTNRGIENAHDLECALETAEAYPVAPLRADITFASGDKVVRYGFNDIAIRNVYQELPADLINDFDLTEDDVSVQSALFDLRVAFGKAATSPIPLMGTGVVLATPYGSSAMSRNYGGPVVDIRQRAIVLTQIGMTTFPRKGFAPVVNVDSAVFNFAIQSLHKRPVMVTFDSFGRVGRRGDPITSVRVSSAPEKTANIVLKDDPGFRAYDDLLP